MFLLFSGAVQIMRKKMRETFFIYFMAKAEVPEKELKEELIYIINARNHILTLSFCFETVF